MATRLNGGDYSIPLKVRALQNCRRRGLHVVFGLASHQAVWMRGGIFLLQSVKGPIHQFERGARRSSQDELSTSGMVADGLGLYDVQR